jgi:hypothetical protein
MSDRFTQYPPGSKPTSLLVTANTASADDVVGNRKLLGRLSRLLRGRAREGVSYRETAFRPTGEGLESIALLSNYITWSGGAVGNKNSPITPANISQLTEKYRVLLDGPILAEPLSATVNVTVGPSRGKQTVVFVATENDSLYAFNTTTGQLLWHRNLLSPVESPLPESVTNFYAVGTTSTPLIDTATNTIYVDATGTYPTGNQTHYVQLLHAINMSNGQDVSGSPVVIADTGYIGSTVVSLKGPSIPGNGAGSVEGRDYFYVQRQLQRPALSIDGNNIILAYASFEDQPPYHGWILTFNKRTLAPTGVFNDTPNGSDGGIWNSGGPVQIDSQGYLYTETGNGTFDNKLTKKGFPKYGDYGDTVLKLQIVPGYTGINGWGIKVVDYFTPGNQAHLEKTDGDLASSGVLLLPNGAGGNKHPNVLLASGKSGTIYVINQNKMGHYHDGPDKVLQEMPKAISGGSYDTPTYYDGYIYYAGVNDALTVYKLVNGHMVAVGEAPDVLAFPGANPEISSSSAKNGIVWVTSSACELIAYDAANISKDLWSAPIIEYSKFSVPNITSNGYVVVGAGNFLEAFGL